LRYRNGGPREKSMAVNQTNISERSLVDLPSTAKQDWPAIGVAILLLLVFGALIPFAGTPLSNLNAFFPSLDAIVFVTSLITSVLLFARFSILHSRSLLALAGGYLFAALIAIPHALTFAGAFSPTGLLGAGIQTGSWLYIFGHFGFVVAVLAYGVFREEGSKASNARTFPAISLTIAGVLALVCGLGWLTTAGSSLLPPIILDKSHIGPLAHYLVALLIGTSAIALLVLWFRRRSVLDQWLMVAVWASILELIFSGLLANIRFSLGFYAGRIFSLVTATIVLIVLLSEITQLYVRLARSNAMLRREQNNRLMSLDAVTSSISHEMKQPLSAISLNTKTAIRFMKRTPPDFEKALSVLSDVVGDAERAGQVLQGVRALFSKTIEVREPLDVNELVLGALRVLRQTINDHAIDTRTALASELPALQGNRAQLHEVMINLFQNAVEAMATMGDGSRVLTARTARGKGDTIVVEVEDTGPGIALEKVDKVFEAFVTTKATGMGLGLAICRTIIYGHGGRLAISPVDPRGTNVRIVLPQRSLAD
jgi:signal transduction histidine kinase